MIPVCGTPIYLDIRRILPQEHFPLLKIRILISTDNNLESGSRLITRENAVVQYKQTLQIRYLTDHETLREELLPPPARRRPSLKEGGL